MASGDITAGWLRQVMERYDPLAAWEPGVAHLSDYTAESARAVAGMRRILGLGHIWTLVADAIDEAHPGFYSAAHADQGELRLSLALIARAAWDRHSWITPRTRTPLRISEGALPAAPSATDMVTDATNLELWLRQVEDHLEAESDVPDRAARVAAAVFRTALPALLTAYAGANEQQREDTRTAFSRFLRVRYQLAGFAGRQLAAIAGPGGKVALRHALLAESLLDQGMDWRDELLLLRDLRERSRTAGLPFDALFAEAAACSSAGTSDFLLGVVREAPA